MTSFTKNFILDDSKQRQRWARLLIDTDGDNAYDLLFQDPQSSDSDYEVRISLESFKNIGLQEI